MKARKVPQRMCVGCQQMFPKKELLRVVRTPEGEIVLDATGKKAGRGVYVCAKRSCVRKAYKEKRFDRALEQAVSPEIYETLLVDVLEDE